MRTFECPVSDRESFVQKLIVKEGLPVPDVYGRADLMFTLAKVVKAEAREAFVFLPFDHVTEVAALGGRIHTGDELSGPRGKAGIYSSFGDLLQAEVPTKLGIKRMNNIVALCERCTREGLPVFIEGSGPVNVLSGLMEWRNLVRCARKDTRGLLRAVRYISGFLVEYYTNLSHAGVAVIGIDDSVGDADFLGEHRLKLYARHILKPFLKSLGQALGERTLIHLCPKGTVALIEAGCARLVPVGTDTTQQTYEQVVRDCVGRVACMGQYCYKDMKRIVSAGDVCAVSWDDVE